jgi:hypothetical protein
MSPPGFAAGEHVGSPLHPLFSGRLPQAERTGGGRKFDPLRGMIKGKSQGQAEMTLRAISLTASPPDRPQGSATPCMGDDKTNRKPILL